ncbi:MAG: 50S ribosomal protein L6 [Micrococcales bacterium]|jgi:large subunit ribosomal protein L6|nr:50S ribosomal protein L6 [Micrococcales bacterium]MBT5431863.1 50S ribosomal protein L6 [Micrococcales bacterium]MBT7926086.1 50S ribosomal protein L6 [Micrococcales bacterium]MDG1817978.1 50S ribosomal protein L6 [Aquiluna sp.]MDG2478747.1 50S ribosomal protein L6 [Aquiluna sp.]
MSRIGKLPIPLPTGVTVEINGQDVAVKGPKGELKITVSEPIKVSQEDGNVIVSRPDDEAVSKSLHGLTRSLIANNVQGVSEGFTKNLEIVGTGYRAAAKGSDLELSLGFSHPVIVTPPAGVSLAVEGNTKIIVSGIDKQAVGEMAANIRKLRKPEPYKGKGVRYEGERVRRKAGKAGK